MTSMRRLGAAVVMAMMVATGLGTATLEAKRPGGDGTAAICAYLNSVITYPGVNSFILATALSLWNSYGCGELSS